MPIRSTIFLLILFVSLVGAFLSFPHLDIMVSKFFFSDEKGFFLARHPALLFIHYGIPVLTKVLIIIYALLLLVWVFFRWSPTFLPPLITLYLLVALVTGPGLIVSLFKEGMGRARPDEITEFHGSKNFSPPFEISNQCQKNCSFLSGHSAMGFYFLAFALVARKYRRTIFTIGFIFGCTVAFSRIMMGKHFLSDVIFSAYFTYLAAFVLYYWVLRLQQHGKPKH